MKKHLQAVWGLILETVFPSVCCGCRREGSFLCDCCFEMLELSEYPSFQTLDCRWLDGVFTCSEYQEGELMARLIHAFKYDFVVDLALPLGRILSTSIKKLGFFNECVVSSVPLYKKRLRWRGFNQASLLANVLCEDLDLSYCETLRRIHFKKAQMELKKEERQANVESAFVLNDDVHVEGKTILLVDDVATTLATLEACAATLKKAGAKKVYGIVLARVYSMRIM